MLGGAVPRDLVSAQSASKRAKIVGMEYRGTGQGIVDTNAHLAFPMSLHRMKPAEWPENYKELKRKRETIKESGTAWYIPSALDSPDEELNKRLVREFLGVDTE